MLDSLLYKYHSLEVLKNKNSLTTSQQIETTREEIKELEVKLKEKKRYIKVSRRKA